MSRIRVLSIAALVLTCGLAAVTSATAGRPASRTAPTCLRTAEHASACNLVRMFFEALDRGRTAQSCSLLGTELWLETGGPSCATFLALSRGAPHAIVGADRTRAGILVAVDVGVHEFDRYRMLRWVALVGHEPVGLRILATHRV
jgi:hypothetical protein